MKRYPYQLWIFLTAEAPLTTEGFFQESFSEWVQVGVCRSQPSKGGEINLEDGTAYTFQSLVHMPLSVATIDTGTKIEVRAGDQVMVSGNVQQWASGQLHNRLWV